MELKKPQTIFEFSEASSKPKRGINLIGFEFDGTACFRKGTRLGPDAIRNVSYGLESYSPYLNLDLEDKEDVYDLGNLPIKLSDTVEEQWKKASDYFLELFNDQELGRGKTQIVTLGGEHSISWAPIKLHLEKFEDLFLIHLDAHADLRDGFEGFHYSHASIMRRALDHFTDKHGLIQYGIRSGTKEEFQWMNENRSKANSLEEFLDIVKSIDDERPIYLTLDLDYFDPAYLPGTGTPEAGGETFHSYMSLLKILKEKNFIGADIVELSPELDQSGNSNVFTSKVLRETILALR